MLDEELRALCIEFDRVHDAYPEHRYEGLAFWKYVKNKKKRGHKVDLFDDYEIDDWYGEIKKNTPSQ